MTDREIWRKYCRAALDTGDTAMLMTAAKLTNRNFDDVRAGSAAAVADHLLACERERFPGVLRRVWRSLKPAAKRGREERRG